MSKIDTGTDNLIFLIALNYFLIFFISSTVGIFFYNLYLMLLIVFLQVIISFIFIKKNKFYFNELKLKYKFIIFLYLFLLSIFLINFLIKGPIYSNDYFRYHISPPIYWAAQNSLNFVKFTSPEINISYGFSTIFYGYLFILFDNLNLSNAFNIINSGILLPLLLFKIIFNNNNYKFYKLLLIFSYLLFFPIFSSFFINSTDINLLIFFLGFFIYLNKFFNIPTLKKEFIFLSGIFLCLAISEKFLSHILVFSTGLVFLTKILKNKKIILIFLTFFLLGNLKYIKNYIKFENPFHPLSQNLVFKEFKSVDYSLNAHMTCKDAKQMRNCFVYNLNISQNKKKNFLKNYSKFVTNYLLLNNTGYQGVLKKNKTSHGRVYYLIIFLLIILALINIYNLIKKKITNMNNYE